MKLRSIAAGAAMALAVAAASAASPAPASAPAAQASATDSLSRAVATVFGTMVNNSLSNLRALGAKVDEEVFVSSITNVLRGRDTGFDFAAADAYVDRYMAAHHPAAPAVDTVSVASQQEYVARAAQADGAVTTPDGVVFIVLTEGEGPMPADGQSARLRYTGRLSDGTVFDRTEEPVVFDVGRLVQGFNTGLRMMRPGGVYRMVIPASAGYGPEGIPGIIPGNSALDFTVELLEVLPGAATSSDVNTK